MPKEWVIQKFNEDLQLWEFVTPKEQSMTRKEMVKQLQTFEKKFPETECRGHNWVNCFKQSDDPYK